MFYGGAFLLWWVCLEEPAGQIMQGLLETSQDFDLWDTNPVSSRPKLHPALEMATLGSENNWTRSKPARNPSNPLDDAT